MVFRNSLPLWVVAVLTFGMLGWMGFFLGAQVWCWISSTSSNVVIRNSARIFGVVIVLGWLLMLYGFLVFWMPYLKGTFVP
jgi:hypothetical protein